MIILNYFPARQKNPKDASGLTAVDISRYRTGKRTQSFQSPTENWLWTCETWYRSMEKNPLQKEKFITL